MSRSPTPVAGNRQLQKFSRQRLHRALSEAYWIVVIDACPYLELHH